MMGAIKSLRHETGVSESPATMPTSNKLVRWVKSAMGKTEIILTLIILSLIIFGFWFIFSGEIWYLVEFLENSLYPTFDAP
jgi:hypothetical protein